MRKGYVEEENVSKKASRESKRVKKYRKRRSRSRSVKTKIKKSKKMKKSVKKDGKRKKSIMVKKRSLSKKDSKVGEHSMKASLVFKSEDLKNNKYWKISRKGNSTTVRFGRMGHKARKKTKEHADDK